MNEGEPLEIVKWGFHHSISSMYEIIPFYHHDIGKATSLFAFLAQHEFRKLQYQTEVTDIMTTQQRYHCLMKLGVYSGHIYKKTVKSPTFDADLPSWMGLMKSYLDQIVDGVAPVETPWGTGYHGRDMVRACLEPLAVFLLEVTTFANLSRLGANSVAHYEDIELRPALEVEPIMHDFLEGCGFKIQLTRFTNLTQTFSFPVGSYENPPIQHISFVLN